MTLDGEVIYNFQKESAKKLMSNVRGIKIFTNNLLLAAEPEEQLEKRRSNTRYFGTLPLLIKKSGLPFLRI
ncbi:hypothetical protein [Mucilaginibacter antarcticus]|uniref:hypothetical protein n=1 Tax=Mucilaginibacter antarcticus TaxID=1855725 RepID=UPI0036311F4C